MMLRFSGSNKLKLQKTLTWKKYDFVTTSPFTADEAVLIKLFFH
jgi:hypothetical protein